MQKAPSGYGLSGNLFFAVTKFSIAFTIAAFLCATATLTYTHAQLQSAAAPSPAVFEYDVASIKLNNSGSASIGSRNSPDGYSISNVPIRALIQLAFGIQNFQIVGSPDWLDSERYDIDAKMDPPVAEALQKLTLEERKVKRQLMLQSLLKDRLNLTIHHETKQLPIYSLVISKSGPKRQETKPDPATPGVPVRRGGPSVRTSRTGGGPITLTVLHCASEDLASVFVPHLGRTVVDKTSLTGIYDFILQFSPEDASAVPSGAAPATLDSMAPSIFTAVQEQLGLKLESGKGPVDVIVIDHVERPSGN